MDTQKRHSGTEKKTRLWGIMRTRIRPIFLSMAVLATLATVLGVIGLVAVVGSVQATPQGQVTSVLLGRITLGPFAVHQHPDFSIHSGNPKDVAMTTITLDEGAASPWHTHPGLTIVMVTQGQVKLTRFIEEEGRCISQVYGPELDQEGFVEPANEVHIARNVGEGVAVLQAIRLNFPVGGPITEPAGEAKGPHCKQG